MSSYHSSFVYKDKNSSDEGLIIAAFDPDTGFTDSFLSMENISDEYYDGTKRFDYGSKYNKSSEIKITIIKKNGNSMKLNDFRSYAKWLTGSRTNSWLDMYVGDTLVYSFLGKFTNLEQYKLDARTVGCKLTFSSVSPWAYSAEHRFNEYLDVLYLDADGVLCKGREGNWQLNIDEDGVLYHSKKNRAEWFSVTDDGVAYLEDYIDTTIDNKSDDLYTYINLDTKIVNKTGSHLSIKNLTLDEESIITGIDQNEEVSLSSSQFIISDKPNKIFGDTFNFKWPRLAPGVNEFRIDGPGRVEFEFMYRYPMKVGDCTMDVSVYGSNIGCCDGEDSPAYDTVKWENIINTPTSLSGYGITDAYTSSEIDDIVDNIECTGGGSGSVDTNIDEQELNNMLNEILG